MSDNKIPIYDLLGSKLTDRKVVVAMSGRAGWESPPMAILKDIGHGLLCVVANIWHEVRR